MASIHDILNPITLTKVVSRIAASSDVLLQFMGMGPGGPNEQFFGHGREGSYHIFDNVRTIGMGRTPGTAAGRRSRRPIGKVPFVYPRMHESVGLIAEEIHNISSIDDPAIRDEAGKKYIRLQATPVAQRAGNWRTAMIVGMLRDSLYYHEDGDDWYFTYTSSGNLSRVNFGMPSGNKDQLDMLGGGDLITVPWNDPSADIPGDITKIDAARQELGVGPIEHIHLTNAMWQNVITNDHVAAGAGIANPPFKVFEREAGTRADGSPMHEKIGQINSSPGIMWHISDDGLELGVPESESFTKHWGDNNAVFMGSPVATDNFSMYLGSEPIAEFDGGPETVRVGMSNWVVKRSNPTATELFTLDNALPVNHVPASVQYATLVGF